LRQHWRTSIEGQSENDVHRLAAAFADENASDAEKHWAPAESKYNPMISHFLADDDYLALSNSAQHFQRLMLSSLARSDGS
jgi:hypothetical protein